MRIKHLGLAALALALLSLPVSQAEAGRRVRLFGQHPQEQKAQKPQRPAKRGEKPFDELIKDRVKIEGLFTLYRDTTDNSLLMEIKPEQFGPIYLCNETRSAAEGAFFDNGSMAGAFPFYFKRVGDNIMMMEKNTRLQADSTSPTFKAVQNGISDNLWASTGVKSTPQDSTEAILIDPSDLFVKDAGNLSYFLGQAGRTGIRFDGKNSYFGEVKSFPMNTEIDVHLHYMTSKPMNGATLASPYDMFHIYHYSISTIPEDDGYVPRLADDRVGHFMTMYMDYTHMDTYSPYVRYINRWNLKKKNPDARVSEPVKPIVYWVENTWPKEYRDAVAEGIEFWNQAFEKIGYRNAIIAKQMPDTATWDPADVRYNTVRWMVMPGGGYAVGPSHANPFTGELYDADIRVSADFIRYMYNNMEYYIQPVSYDGSTPEKFDPLKEMKEFEREHNPFYCDYASESAQEAAFGYAYLMSTSGDLANKDSLTQEYVYSYIVNLVAHEVGHTLGMRHNFKGSSIYPLNEIQSRKFTREHATGGSVMDYVPPNIPPKGQPQGEFYASVPGPYDDWYIEYTYSDFGGKTPEEDWPYLEKIAARAGDPDLAYGTDEDAFGSGPMGIDPDCMLFDQGQNPLNYCDMRIKMTRDLWSNSMKDFEKPGMGYQQVLRAFSSGWRAYLESVNFASRQVGAVHHNRFHVGDAPGTLPFKPVSAAQQKRAMKFLADNVFAADAFDLPASLVNKLQPERLYDFTGRMFSSSIDYPLHARVLRVQNMAINYLYNPVLLARLQNNLERYAPGEEKYTMENMFTDLRRSIWGELNGPSDVNSYRRQLQLLHLKRLGQMYLMDSSVFPSDAITLAANDIDVIEGAAKKALQSNNINNMTRAHLKEVLRQIDSIKGAKRDYTNVSAPRG